MAAVLVAIVGVAGNIAGKLTDIIITEQASKQITNPPATALGTALNNPPNVTVTCIAVNPDCASEPTMTVIPGLSAKPDLSTSATVECHGVWLVPTVDRSPAYQFQAAVSRHTSLWPVPSDSLSDIGNAAFYPSLYPNQLFGILGRVDNLPDRWLYISVSEGNQNGQYATDQYGFIRLENTNFTENFNALPGLSIPLCPK